MATLSLPDFTPGLAAACVDKALRAAISASDQARQCAALWFAEVARRGLYRELGFASLEQYACEGLGFSQNRYWQFRRLAEDLERLPALREAVTTGQVGWTKAQQITRVATPETEAAWVEKAQTLGRRALELEVRSARRRPATVDAEPVLGLVELGPGAQSVPTADPPIAVTFRLDGVNYARYEALVERLRKLGLEGDREQLLLMALEALAAQAEAAQPADLRRRKSGSPVRMVIQRCPDCERAAVVTSQGERRLSAAQADAAACDAVVHQGRRNRATIAPAVREAVLARDGHRCQGPGCRRTRFLEVHHVVPRSRGGTNQARNLVTLCSRCHRFQHEHPAAFVPAQVVSSTDMP